jgi:hypothetical protein
MSGKSTKSHRLRPASYRVWELGDQLEVPLKFAAHSQSPAPPRKPPMQEKKPRQAPMDARKALAIDSE